MDSGYIRERIQCRSVQLLENLLIVPHSVHSYLKTFSGDKTNAIIIVTADTLALTLGSCWHGVVHDTIFTTFGHQLYILYV